MQEGSGVNGNDEKEKVTALEAFFINNLNLLRRVLNAAEMELCVC